MSHPIEASLLKLVETYAQYVRALGFDVQVTISPDKSYVELRGPLGEDGQREYYGIYVNGNAPLAFLEGIRQGLMHKIQAMEKRRLGSG